MRDSPFALHYQEWWRAVETHVRLHCKGDLDYLLDSYIEDCFDYWQVGRARAPSPGAP